MSNQLLTEQELQQLNEVKQQIISIASALGEIEYQTIILEHEREKLADEIKQVKQTEQALLKSFGQKYGDGIINLETGEINPRS